MPTISNDILQLLVDSIRTDLQAEFNAKVADLLARAEAAAIHAARTKVREPERIVIVPPDLQEKNLGIVHRGFTDLLATLNARTHAWVFGPAGTGKTTAALRAAEALGLTTRITGAIDADYRLSGFVDAQGRVVSTEFRRAWTEGGVFIFDDIDASSPQALTAFNAALANGVCAFPDQTLEQHKDFFAIVTANTNGGGGTSEYTARTKQDAAVRDRFLFLEWEIDESLERGTCHDLAWCDLVQKCRALVRKHGVSHLVTPRATYMGERLIASYLSLGRSRDEAVEKTCLAALRKGIAKDTWAKINPLTNTL